MARQTYAGYESGAHEYTKADQLHRKENTNTKNVVRNIEKQYSLVGRVHSLSIAPVPGVTLHGTVSVHPRRGHREDAAL